MKLYWFVHERYGLLIIFYDKSISSKLFAKYKNYLFWVVWIRGSIARFVRK